MTCKKGETYLIMQYFKFIIQTPNNRVLVGKPEGKRPLGRPRHRWADNIKVVLQEVGCGSIDWIELAQDRSGHL
jgi:hypothetical protein